MTVDPLSIPYVAGLRRARRDPIRLVFDPVYGWIIPLDEGSKLKQAKDEELRIQNVRDAARGLVRNLGRACLAHQGAWWCRAVKGHGYYVIHFAQLSVIDHRPRTIEHLLTIYKDGQKIFRVSWADGRDEDITIHTMKRRIPSGSYKLWRGTFIELANCSPAWTHEESE